MSNPMTETAVFRNAFTIPSFRNLDGMRVRLVIGKEMACMINGIFVAFEPDSQLWYVYPSNKPNYSLVFSGTVNGTDAMIEFIKEHTGHGHEI